MALAADASEEAQAVADFLRKAVADGIAPAEIGIFVRFEAELSRARVAADAAGLPTRTMLDCGDVDAALAGTMHFAKGLEFRAVALLALRRRGPATQREARRCRRRVRTRRGHRDRTAALLRRRDPRPRPAVNHCRRTWSEFLFDLGGQQARK
jgi:hypothetical protein